MVYRKPLNSDDHGPLKCKCHLNSLDRWAFSWRLDYACMSWGEKQTRLLCTCNIFGFSDSYIQGLVPCSGCLHLLQVLFLITAFRKCKDLLTSCKRVSEMNSCSHQLWYSPSPSCQPPPSPHTHPIFNKTPSNASQVLGQLPSILHTPSTNASSCSLAAAMWLRCLLWLSLCLSRICSESD